MTSSRSVALREPIAQSWHRASLAGLAPATALLDLRTAEVDPASHLLSAAAPVLEDLDERLAGTAMSTVLVDHEGRMVHRWSADRAAEDCFEELGLEIGSCLLEDVVGTNGPGTALETRSSIVVHGEEHYAEALRGFSCYGHPIFHPVTRRLEGALDITLLAAEANPLLAPLVAKAVEEIERQLLEGSKVSERSLLAAFQAASRRTRPVVAIGPDLLLCNQAAADLLDGSDVAQLWNLAGEVAGPSEMETELRSGQRVRVRAEPVSGARGGVLVEIRPLGTGETRRRGRVRQVSPAAIGHVHISGPPGAGRTTEAQLRAPACTLLTGAQAVLGGSAVWAAQFQTAVEAGSGTICVDGADLLPAELVDLVARHAATGAGPNLVLTTGPREGLSGPERALVASCAESVELLPLAHRSDFPEVAMRMLAELGAGRTHNITPGAMRILGSYDWPGNLPELRGVLGQAIRKRSAGAIGPADLPPTLLADASGHELAPIERAERNAIVAALRSAGGNKVKAAGALGISRTTLYARMRALKVPG
ncbi:sigma-54-dependent Fis family transcriptional regulator [Amycolatopsis benzoatilytica]|uniref:sigma-54-dependent Fis family transcriptional regulator n=1 Tax=Amycolatopsis benzoatilytica TaxID=346045 RepID=UPI000487AEAB|nr:helix-turn-helix domain-containing protein [Amycolatopsis benzoatilytica]